jgi:hypothetical protein
LLVSNAPLLASNAHPPAGENGDTAGGEAPGGSSGAAFPIKTIQYNIKTIAIMVNVPGVLRTLLKTP